ncbi:DUF2256 domain-containing protein [Flavobacterium sp. GCM10023249]|uniref:DUF2256 domain-containing protein n=1 Tax=unclassified Flavobacterium TaxID=196869 RepID=UPI00360F1C98
MISKRKLKSTTLKNTYHKGNKSYLPSKICSSCGKPFSWRKKWEKNWEEVKYCSDSCRKSKVINHLE